MSNNGMSPAEIREHLADLVQAGQIVALPVEPDGLVFMHLQLVTTPTQLATALTARELAAWFAAHPLQEEL